MSAVLLCVQCEEAMLLSVADRRNLETPLILFSLTLEWSTLTIPVCFLSLPPPPFQDGGGSPHEVMLKFLGMVCI